MTLQNLDYMLECTTLECDMSLSEVDIMLEHVDATRTLATRVSALKCIQENADSSAFFALESDNDASWLKKVAEGFIKAFEAVKRFVTESIQHVQDFFTEETNTRNIKKLTEMVNSNPGLKVLRIQTSEAPRGLIETNKTDKALAALQQKIASGAVKDTDLSAYEVQSKAANTKEVTYKTGKISGALFGCTVVQGLNYVKEWAKTLNSLKNMLEAVKNNTNTLSKKALALPVAGKDSAQKVMSVGRARLTNIRNYCRSISLAISATIRAIFTAVRENAGDASRKTVMRNVVLPRKGELNPDNRVLESAEDDDESFTQLYNELFNESADGVEDGSDGEVVEESAEEDTLAAAIENLFDGGLD